MNKTIKKFQTGFLTSIKPERLFKTFAIIACLLIAGAFLTLGGNVIVKDGQLNVTSDFFVGTDVLFVDSAENKVGIGTTSPSQKLEVVGNLNATGNITLGQKITFALGEFIDNLADGWLRITGSLNITEDLNVIGNITGSSPVKIKGGLNVLNASGTTHLYVNDTTGNVGIGTTDPGSAKLKISGGVLDMNSNKITNLTDPTSNQDAATKKYVDDALPTLACANHSALPYNAPCTTICTGYLGMQCVVAFADDGAHISCETDVGPSYYGGHCYCCGLVY